MWWNYTGGYRNALEHEQSVLTMENAPAACRWPMGPAEHWADSRLGMDAAEGRREEDLAVEYLTWFSRPEVLKKYIINVHRDAPPRCSLINDPDVIEAVPTLALPVGWETILAGAKFASPSSIRNR